MSKRPMYTAEWPGVFGTLTKSAPVSDDFTGHHEKMVSEIEPEEYTEDIDPTYERKITRGRWRP